MSIPSIVRSVEVKTAPDRAFELFSARMGDWWPRARIIGPGEHAAVVIEPHTGGRWFERNAEGVETQWGKVLAWEPPGRLLLGWQIGTDWKFDPDLLTELELTFEGLAGGGTLVTLEHRNMERFGAGAEAHRGRLDSGWPGMLASYAALLAKQEDNHG